MATTETYRVQGMTCEHCVAAVSGEISKLAGVTGVDVVLSTGEVAVTSEHSLDAQAVKEAVDEAGYEMAP